MAAKEIALQGELVLRRRRRAHCSGKRLHVPGAVIAEPNVNSILPPGIGSLWQAQLPSVQSPAGRQQASAVSVEVPSISAAESHTGHTVYGHRTGIRRGSEPVSCIVLRWLALVAVDWAALVVRNLARVDAGARRKVAKHRVAEAAPDHTPGCRRALLAM